MGYYINPPDREKEDWLLEHGQQVNDPTWPAPKGLVPVCLVDNGSFTVAAIVYDEREFQEFVRPDSRPRTWFYVPFEAVIDVEPRVQDRLNV